MKTRLALLCFRVARWLAPQYFKYPDFTIKQMSDYHRQLAQEYTSVPRNSHKANFLVGRIAEVGRTVEYLKLVGAYEQVKVEIQTTDILTASERDRIVGGEKASEIMREKQKRALFTAVVQGFAQSAEIDKFLYYREHGPNIRTIGIRLYLKHAE